MYSSFMHSRVIRKLRSSFCRLFSVDSFSLSGSIKDALSVLLPRTGKYRAAKYKQISRTSNFTTSARTFEKRLKAGKRILVVDKCDDGKAWKRQISERGGLTKKDYQKTIKHLSRINIIIYNLQLLQYYIELKH